eukprot:g41524.t1
MAQATEVSRPQRKTGTSRQPVSVFLARDGKVCFNCRKPNHIVKNCSVRCLRPECSNKPTHTGGECKMRGPTQRGGNNNFTKSKSRTPTNGKRANPPRNANSNRPHDPRKPKVNVVKHVAYVAKPATERKFDEVDDAWAGLTVERMIEDNPQLGQIAVEELYKLPPETIKIPAAQEGTPNEPPAKKQKGDEEALKPLKRCAHIDINGACAYYDCPLVMSDDIDESAQTVQGPNNEVAEVPMDCENADVWLESAPVKIARSMTVENSEPFYDDVTEKYVKQIINKDVNKHIKARDGSTTYVEGEARGSTETWKKRWICTGML